ncbi:MAG: succinate dehydrogenase cytochrome b subunit [Muribaculaceae bacterium]|nr:succinate dehydrogenase cytochrome b subunit [Muribaculaceae bacterium]MDE6559029.1 succinate dehydrogenase cytochrome b subunit [Muribaculaceae bacterium]
MWLSDSSVGRKFIMAVTGAVLVLFVTFHCLMNAVAILWPAAYNSVCMFLGANWYALAASAGLALFIIVHIIYAVVLTVQNRRARGHERYAISKRPAGVEWSSQNMLVLGIVILAFLVVHLIQFWAKMQLVEIFGCETLIPATAGTLFLQEAFSQYWTGIVYLIGFCALWFHLTHGFWSMFQSVGWDSTVWIPRLKCIAQWWVGIVTALFVIEAVVFTVNAKKDFYKNDADLRAQYMSMVIPEIFDDLGPDAVQQISAMPADQLPQMVDYQINQLTNPQIIAMQAQNPEFKKVLEAFVHMQNFLNYLDGKEAVEMPAFPEAAAAPAAAMPGAQMQGEAVEVVEAEEAPAAQPEAQN